MLSRGISRSAAVDKPAFRQSRRRVDHWRAWVRLLQQRASAQPAWCAIRFKEPARRPGSVSAVHNLCGQDT